MCVFNNNVIWCMIWLRFLGWYEFLILGLVSVKNFWIMDLMWFNFLSIILLYFLLYCFDVFNSWINFLIVVIGLWILCVIFVVNLFIIVSFLDLFVILLYFFWFVMLWIIYWMVFCFLNLILVVEDLIMMIFFLVNSFILICGFMDILFISWIICFFMIFKCLGWIKWS